MKLFKILFGAFKGITGIVYYTLEILVTIAAFFLLIKIGDILAASLVIKIVGCVIVVPIFLTIFFASVKIALSGFLKSLVKRNWFLIIFQIIMLAANGYLIYNIITTLNSVGVHIF